MPVETPDVLVVGGGVIGSSVAWRAAATGRTVTLVDPDPLASASWVAGGMLAPVTEAWPGEEAILELGADSLSRWPAFAEDLLAGGHDPGLNTHGTLVLCVDSADRAVLDTLLGYLRGRDREVNALTGRELRGLEPSIGPAVPSGLSVPGDLAVDNRKLLDALHAAGAAHGVRRVAGHARSVRGDGVELVDGSTLAAGTVVLAAGAWSCRLHPSLASAVRPVKGEVLRLRARPGSLPPPRSTLRGLVEGRAVYLVPREGGELVLGATQYEVGFDTEPVAAGVRDLLGDGERLLPAIADYALLEVRAGLRAGSVDNLPMIGWLEPRVLAATGHHRNGLLLAPITADAVLAVLDGAGLPDYAAAADVSRLAVYAR
ncbi:MAG: glycine oxidase ThiO [Sciscionella sp.]